MNIKLTHPVPGAPLTSPFGWRDGFYSGGVWVPPMLHNGADFGAPAGAPILAMHTGRVDFNGWDGDGGWTVGVRGDVGRSLYSHMRTQSADVHVGQIVAAGQIIGRVGSSGLATGPHLHAMFDHGSGWVDPIPFINKNNDAPTGQKVDDEMIFVGITGKAGARRGGVYAVFGGSEAVFVGNATGENIVWVKDESAILSLQKRISGLR